MAAGDVAAGGAGAGGSGAREWIVVITKLQNERMVARDLERKGFEVYLPMCLKEGRDGGSYPAPLLPRYLFARMALSSLRWQSLLSTVGVARVLCTPARPIGVREEFLAKLRAKEVAGYVAVGCAGAGAAGAAQGVRLKKGDRITTLGGAVEALVSETIDGKRATLLASLFNSDSVRITVDLRKQAARSIAVSKSESST